MREIVLLDKEELKKEKINEFTYGKRPDGTDIGNYQDVEYAIFKNEINPLARGKVDLIHERSFINALVMKPTVSKKFIFDSSDFKTDKLTSKYGMDIMGINKEYFDEKQKTEYKSKLISKISYVLNKM